jgi:hypothetical protein
MRCDGAILLSVEAFGDQSVEGREVWIGVVLNDTEITTVRKRTENYAQETAARIVGGLVA